MSHDLRESYFRLSVGIAIERDMWDKVFKSGPSKICGRQPLKTFTWSTLEYFVPCMYNQ